MEFDLSFSDVTILQAEGDYDDVKKIIESTPSYSVRIGSKWIKTPIGPHDWVIKSNLTILSDFHRGEMVLDFYWDRRVYIVNFGSTLPDKWQNPDIRCLSAWAQESGWKVPQPTEAVVRSSQDFWKHMWDTGIIDCEWFDKQYGKRHRIDEQHNRLKDMPEEDFPIE